MNRFEQDAQDLRVINSRKEKTFPGETFGRLTVLARIASRGRGHRYACVCACGNFVAAEGGEMRRGNRLSCGCIRLERCSRFVKGTPEHNTWRALMERCYSVNHNAYKNYGGRGITVCDRWKESFQAFLSDMGPRPAKGMSIDRIDVNGNYEPGNCRWATVEQQVNNKRTNHYVFVDGERMTLTEAARRRGMNPRSVAARVTAYGWSLERALSEPFRESRRPHAINTACHAIMARAECADLLNRIAA